MISLINNALYFYHGRKIGAEKCYSAEQASSIFVSMNTNLFWAVCRNIISLVAPASLLQLGTAASPKSTTDTISTSVSVVIAPTAVRAKSGQFVKALQIQDFEIYDNDRIQKISADMRDSLFSLVVAIQRSADMTYMLPKVQRIGSALMDLVVGRDAEVAVVGFDDRVHIYQEFTSDADKVCRAMMSLTTGTHSHATVDAVVESVRMLQNRPRERHRIILVISEKWDKGSHASLREALIQTQFANITIYSLNISTAVAELRSEPMPQRPPAIPATAEHVPAGAPLTPTTIEQNYYLGNWAALFVDVFHSVENIFTDNSLEALTRFTGGQGFSFNGVRSLDKAIQDLSEDLHSQYLLSYSPNDLEEGGFHQIRVIVKHPDLIVRTRPGYWIVGKPQ